MKKISIVLLGVLFLVGCGKTSEKKETVTICTTDQPYAMYESGEQTLISKGDRVNKIKVKALMDLEDKDVLDELEDGFDDLVKDLVNSDGVKFSIERVDDTKVYDMSEIDLTLADMEELGELGLLQMDSEAAKVGLVSLKKSITFIENLGFVCETESN